jgi:hypothetical protein
MRKELENGQLVKVGDVIEVKTSMTNYILTVERVTKKFSFAKFEGNNFNYKFPREYIGYSFAPLPKEKWRTTTYKIYRE